MTTTGFSMRCLYFTAMLLGLVTSQCRKQWKDHKNFQKPAERTYYIACVEEEWDYCPSGKNLISDQSIEKGTDAAIWCLGDGATRIGSTYLKGLYRQFETKCFESQKDRSDRDEHLGALGPNIRALTGETIKIFYKNMCSFPTSMHPHGLKYDKLSEGAVYSDPPHDINGGDMVMPGDNWIYIWKTRRNMVDTGLSSQMWLYHSHVNEPREVNTGLVGAIIITVEGMERSEWNLRPKDVNREFTTFMMLYDENDSLLFDANLRKYLGISIKDTGVGMLLKNEDFIESNLMHAINGYLFGNLEHLESKEGETVRWYTASFGNEGDGPHSPHWHGNIAVDAQGQNTDTVVLIPGTTKTVTMEMDAPGLWLYHCHVHDHIDAGMLTTYWVEPNGGTTSF